MVNIIDELSYRNYRYNRLRTPDISPDRYSVVYSDWKLYEIRFQLEQNTRGI